MSIVVSNRFCNLSAPLEKIGSRKYQRKTNEVTKTVFRSIRKVIFAQIELSGSARNYFADLRIQKNLTVNFDDERNAQIASTCIWIEQNSTHNISSRLCEDELVCTSLVGYSVWGAEKRFVTGE